MVWTKGALSEEHKKKISDAKKGIATRTGPWKNRRTNSKYMAAHMRVRRLRGSASTYVCPCGRQAAHWAFQWRSTPKDRWMVDHGQTSRTGGFSLYSLTESDYEALCGRCASWYDRDTEVRTFYEQSLAGGSDRLEA